MVNKQVHRCGFRSCVVALLLLVIALVSGQFVLPAFANTVRLYTSVLTDLQSDAEFNVADYPAVSNDYSIQLIQIAESSDGELFVYTYQPCMGSRIMPATDINMSLNDTVEGTKLYSLQLIDFVGVFAKYLVKGVTVSSDSVRYYTLSTIYRNWYKDVDSASVRDNTVNGVGFPVGWLWMATTEGDTVTYSATATELIRVYEEYLFMLRFSDGFKFHNIKSCDAHFLSFNTDKPVTHIFEAKLEFVTRDYTKVKGQSAKYSDPVKHEVTLLDTDVFSFKGAQFDRIERTADFLENSAVNLDDEDRQLLASRMWIFDFYETNYQSDFGGDDILWWMFVPFYGQYKFVKDAITTRGTLVTEAVVLRLKYAYDGQIYDVGVVSNKQSGSNTPRNLQKTFWETLGNLFGVSPSKAKTIFIVVVIVIALAILLPVLSAIFPVFGQVLAMIFKGLGIGLLWLLKGLWWLICLPFKGIAALVRKIKEKQG